MTLKKNRSKIVSYYLFLFFIHKMKPTLPLDWNWKALQIAKVANAINIIAETETNSYTPSRTWIVRLVWFGEDEVTFHIWAEALPWDTESVVLPVWVAEYIYIWDATLRADSWSINVTEVL